MEITTRAIFTRGSAREKANVLMWTAVSTRVNMIMTSPKETEPTAGKTARAMKVNGKTEFSKEKASSTFQMERCLMECGRMDCRQAWEFANTPMGAVTMEIGRRASHMV